MLGFSLQKLLVLAGLILAVWYGFRFVSRLQEARSGEPRVRAGGGPSKADKKGRKAPERAAAEDMVKCQVCQAYVPARGASSCGRADCPY